MIAHAHGESASRNPLSKVSWRQFEDSNSLRHATVRFQHIGRVENYTTKICEDFFAALDEVLDDMDFLKSAGRNMGEIKNECKNMALFSNVISKRVA